MTTWLDIIYGRLSDWWTDLVINWELLAPLPRALVVALVVVLALWAIRPRGLFVSKHQRNISKSHRVLKRIRSFHSSAEILKYLRRIDPYVFEEVVLTGFQQAGCRIRRNLSYSGDGGQDGQIWLNGKRHLIQTKRYSRHIATDHVKAFCRLVDRSRCRGFFIHTGRASKSSEAVLTDQVRIISGAKLVALLRDCRLPK